MLTQWPPTDLDGDGLHILVTFGDPFSPRLQRRKLESLLNRVPTGDAWRVYAPDIYYMGGCCGAVFSTADRAAFQRELQAVKDIRYGVGGAGASVHRGSSLPDPVAYTDLQVIDVDSSIEEASAALDRALEEHESTPEPEGDCEDATAEPTTAKTEGDSGRQVGKSTILVVMETTAGVRYSYEVPSSFDLGERPMGRDGKYEWVVGEGEKTLVKRYLGRVYEGHKAWLLSQSAVSRRQWTEHLETYGKDKNLDDSTKQEFVSALRICYLCGEGAGSG